jgi:hypothetical protein
MQTKSISALRGKANLVRAQCSRDSPESRRAAQLPERPSSLQQFHIKGKGAICEPLHRGPISRPYPHREPVLIGVPLELLAEPDLMDKPSLQTL